MKIRINAVSWLLWYMIGASIWITLVLLKATGAAYIMGWLPLGLGIFWIPVAITTAAYFWGRSYIRYHEWKRRRKVARVLWEAMHGLTLNSVGPIYGVQRKAGEKNKEYERRILKAASTVDKVNLAAPATQPIKPATGQKLDAIAKKHGLTRRPGESDAALQGRIRTAVIEKLERRKENGV